MIEAIQADGTCWCGPTLGQGRTAMRISVCSWRTTEADVDRSLAAILRVAVPLRAYLCDRDAAVRAATVTAADTGGGLSGALSPTCWRHIA